MLLSKLHLTRRHQRNDVTFRGIFSCDRSTAPRPLAARQPNLDREADHRLPAANIDRLGASFTDGRDLSGGQWQRLAVARALYRRADFLLLDEPGAHLDPDAELALFRQLRQQVDDGETTVVVSTHRASTLRFADRVILIDRGHVVCEASGADALGEGPIAKLFASQLM